MRNLGQGPLVLGSVEQLSGEVAFRVELSADLQLAAGASTESSVFFQPPLFSVRE